MKQLEAGRDISVKDTKRAASAMVDSVIRNPDAFSWLARVKEIDEHTYTHAMRSAVWGILFGRHIGLGKTDLDTLALGILLKDVGKVNIDNKLIAKKERTPAEDLEYEKSQSKQTVAHRHAFGRLSLLWRRRKHAGPSHTTGQRPIMDV